MTSPSAGARSTADRPSTVSVPRRILDRIVGLARHAWRWEVGVWVSLWRFLTRRPRVPAGGVAFSYHAPVRMILAVFIVLSAVEIPIIDLVVHRWPVVRVLLLAAGIWGLMWMVGLLLGFITRPHSVGPLGVRLQEGTQVSLDVPWDDVLSVGLMHDVANPPPKPPRVSEHPDGSRTLHLRMQQETNLEIELERPLELQLPWGTETVTAIRFWADDPREFLRASRPYLTADAS